MERDVDLDRDLPALLALVAKARASGHPHALVHPGGLQWLLRKFAHPDFTVSLSPEGLIVDDAGYVILQAVSTSVGAHLQLLDRAAEDRRRRGGTAIEISVWDDDAELLAAVRSLGYAPSAGHQAGYELIHTIREPVAPSLPNGFEMRWLEPGLDDAYVELHRAAWSTIKPSTYDRAAHAAVVAMPDFDRALVPIVAAPDGTLAASCIAWFDPVTRTSEIEPLGTHPGYRRRGLARAVSVEAVRRSAERGATSVLVWGVGDHRIALYRSAGFLPARVGREYARTL